MNAIRHWITLATYLELCTITQSPVLALMLALLYMPVATLLRDAKESLSKSVDIVQHCNDNYIDGVKRLELISPYSAALNQSIGRLAKFVVRQGNSPLPSQRR